MTPDNRLKCSLCGKSQAELKKLIAGPGVYVCNECLNRLVLIFVVLAIAIFMLFRVSAPVTKSNSSILDSSPVS